MFATFLLSTNLIYSEGNLLRLIGSLIIEVSERITGVDRDSAFHIKLYKCIDIWKILNKKMDLK